MEKDKKTSESSALRQQAEWQVKTKSGGSEETAGMSPTDMANLIHELRVHQIELKMQNEELRRIQEELEAARDRYSNLYDFAPVGYLTVNERGIVEEVNLTFTALIGMERPAVVGKPFSGFIHREEQDVYYLHRQRILESGNFQSFRLRLVKKDGSDFYTNLECMIISKNDCDTRQIRIAVSDITEQRELENQLNRAQKMESLGLVAGGIAHDLNNVLSGIVSYPELLLLDIPEDSKLRKPIETMRSSGHRAAAIVQDLLTVAKGVATAKEPLNINNLVREYLDSPEFKKLAQFHPSVTIKTSFDADIFNVSGSEIHIRKVVMNLVSNASEAIEGDGTVTISTMNRYVDRHFRGYDEVNIGEYAVLSVSDDGSGIPPDDLERIFEPFYTKKFMGRSGTGLGLTVVWNVVQDHKAYIDVTSDEHGTTIELYFPITRDEISGDNLSRPVNDYRGDGQTILVVDDVESQREISCNMLDTLGYKTESVSSGEEAVEYLKKNTVDLLLLDMIMDPGINGLETYKRIIKIHPSQKAVIVSGFAETGEVREIQKLGAGKFIKKPLLLEKIGLAVKEELRK